MTNPTEAAMREPTGFSVGYRNPGHWDIYVDRGRAFRIRGEPGRVVVMDERKDTARPFPRDNVEFRSVQTALIWCAEELGLS